MNRPTILLAEDNPVNQKVAALRLKRLGYEVEVQPDGKRAIEAFQSSHHDIILMDAQMPVMNGMEAASWIRENVPADKQPKIFVMSATMIAEARQIWKSIDVDGFIEKPVQVDLLRQYLSDAAGDSDGDAGGSG